MMRLMTALQTWRHDVVAVLRQLRRSRLYSAIAVLSLAFGIAATGAAFTTLDAILWRPLVGVHDPASLARLYFDHRGASSRDAPTTRTSYPIFEELRDDASAVATFAAFHERSVTFGEGESADLLRAQLVSPNYFQLLGTRPALGRLFGEEDGAADQAVVAISYRLWTRDFGRRADVLGRTLRVDGHPLTVIAVLPDGFEGLEHGRIDLWLPVALATIMGPGAQPLVSRGTNWIELVARLRPAVGPRVVESAIAAVLARHGDLSDAGTAFAGVTIAPLPRALGPTRSAQITVDLCVAAVAVLLLVAACLNVTGLALARRIEQSHALMVRLALGARTWDIARVALLESVLLTVAGAGTGFVLLRSLMPVIRRLSGIDAARLDLRTFWFASAVTGIVSIVIALAPVLHARRLRAVGALGRRAHDSASLLLRLRGVLIVSQVALCYLLLVGSTVFIHAFRSVTHVELGADPDRMLVAEASADPAVSDATAKRLAYTRLRDVAARLPFVSDIGTIDYAPFGARATVAVEELGSLRTLDALQYAVDSTYFRAAGVPLIAGRPPRTPLEVVVNEALAARLRATGSLLGECLVHSALERGTCQRVVGIARTLPLVALLEAPTPALYAGIGEDELADFPALVMRGTDATDRDIERARHALQGASAAVSYVRLRSLAQVIEPQVRPLRLGLLIFSLFGVMAQLLAAFGTYAIATLLVRQQQREIGIRLALGSSPARMAGRVLRDGLVLGAAGLLVGTVLALGASKVALGGLAGVDALDYSSLALAAIATLAALVLALAGPARRAMRTTPLAIIRGD